jgi:hypothetical protein
MTTVKAQVRLPFAGAEGRFRPKECPKVPDRLTPPIERGYPGITARMTYSE